MLFFDVKGRLYLVWWTLVCVSVGCAGGMAGLANAQQTDKFHPTWYSSVPGFPSIPSSYTQVREGELIAKAGERLTFLPISIRQPDTINPTILPQVSPQSTLSVGQSAGFQVLDMATGRQFVVDSIKNPRCVVYAQQVVQNDDFGFSTSNNIVSNVHIEQINFDDCQ